MMQLPLDIVIILALYVLYAMHLPQTDATNDSDVHFVRSVFL
jgi:hypothetical protein